MKGAVIKRGGKWSVVVDVGRDATTGRRIRRWHSGYSTKREAERARVDILGRLDRGTYVKPEKTTLASFLSDEWLPAIRASVREGTFAEYWRCVDKYVGTSAGAPAADAFFANMQTEHRLLFELEPQVLRAIDMRVYQGKRADREYQTRTGNEPDF